MEYKDEVILPDIQDEIKFVGKVANTTGKCFPTPKTVMLNEKFIEKKDIYQLILELEVDNNIISSKTWVFKSYPLDDEIQDARQSLYGTLLADALATYIIAVEAINSKKSL